MEQLNTRDAAVQLESLDLLAEVSRYLGRLPVHPMTHAMQAKIDRYLQQPGAKANAARLEGLAKDRDWRERLDAGECFTGESSFTPEGAPVVNCLVLNGFVHLRSPALADAAASGDTQAADQLAMNIGHAIAAGMGIKVSSVGPAMAKYVQKSWPRIELNIKGSTP